jgi:hypothetical protein
MEQQLQAGVDPACRAIWRSPLRMMPSGDYAIGCAREPSGGASSAHFKPLLQLELAKEARLREERKNPQRITPR